MENTCRSPRELFWTAFLVLALSPLFRFSWDIASQTFFHLLIAGSLCFALARHRAAFRTFPEIPLLIFFAAASVSYFFAADRSVSRAEIFVLFDTLSFCLLFSLLEKRDRKRLLLIPPVIGVGFTAASLAFFIYSPENLSFGQFIPSEAVVNTNAVAGFLLLSFILSLIPVPEAGKARGILALPVILFTGIILTRSRAAVIAASAGSVFYAWPYLSAKLKRSTAAAAVLIGAVVIVITLLKHSASFGERLVWWQAAFRMLSEHPLTGIGWGNYGVSYLAYRPQLSLNTTYAHNFVLQTAAESGLPGIIALLLLIVSFIRLSISNRARDAVTRGTSVAAAAFLGFSLLDFSFYLPAHLFLLAACAGTLYERRAEPRLSSPARLLYGTAFLLWALTVIPPFAASRWYARGLYFQQRGETAAAASAFVTSFTIDPLSPAPYSSYAQLLFGSYSENHDPALLSRAISVQERAVQSSPVTAAYWSDLAWLYKAAGRNDNALSAMRRAALLDPFNRTYKKNLSLPGSGS